MRIGVISDIHIDRNRDYPILELLVEKAAERQLGCLLIAGDISDTQSLTLDFVDRFAELSGIPVYFVPGNHDMWNKSNGVPDTNAIYRRYQAHPACLIGKSIPLSQDWVVFGDIGWYDYSFGHKSYSESDFNKKSRFGRTWQDSVYIDWQRGDKLVHQNMLAGLEKQITDASDKNCIVLTHMITADAFTVPESRQVWSYFNAFLGSRDYGDLFEREGVRYSVMGHVHYRRQLCRSGVMYICACLNYHTEWLSHDCAREIDKALTIIDLNNNENLTCL